MSDTKVIMPQMGESIFEGTLTKWLKQAGDQVARDEPLFEISTDKVDAEIPYVVPIGRAALRREGGDLTILTYAAMLYPALEAAETMSRENGIEVEVVDLRSLLPLDKDAILDSTRKTGKVLIVHEDTRTGGIAGEIAAIINEEIFEYLDGPVMRVTSPDTPVPYSPPLEAFCLPNKDKILQAARQLAAY